MNNVFDIPSGRKGHVVVAAESIERKVLGSLWRLVYNRSLSYEIDAS